MEWAYDGSSADATTPAGSELEGTTRPYGIRPPSEWRVTRTLTAPARRAVAFWKRDFTTTGLYILARWDASVAAALS